MRIILLVRKYDTSAPTPPSVTIYRWWLFKHPGSVSAYGLHNTLQHNLKETALTSMLAIVYYFVYIRASKTTLRLDYDDIEQDVSFKD